MKIKDMFLIKKSILWLSLLVLWAYQGSAQIVITVTDNGSDATIASTGGTVDVSGLAFDGVTSWINTVSFGSNTSYGVFTTGGHAYYNGGSVEMSDGWVNSGYLDGPSTYFQTIGFTGTQLNLTSTLVNPFENVIVGQTLSTMGLVAGESISYTWDGGASYVTLQTSAVPEPSTYAAIFGLLSLGFIVYKKKKKA